MPRSARVPPQLAFRPFRGSEAVASGLLTRRMLDGPTWLRLLPDVYVRRNTDLDHRTWCSAVALLVPPNGAIGGLSAACLFGVDLVPRDAPVTVVVPRTGRLRAHPRLAMIRAVLPATDVMRSRVYP